MAEFNEYVPFDLISGNMEFHGNENNSSDDSNSSDDEYVEMDYIKTDDNTIILKPTNNTKKFHSCFELTALVTLFLLSMFMNICYVYEKYFDGNLHFSNPFN